MKETSFKLYVPEKVFSQLTGSSNSLSEWIVGVTGGSDVAGLGWWEVSHAQWLGEPPSELRGSL